MICYYRHAQAAAGNTQDIFSRLGRPTPRLPFSLPLSQGLFPRISTPFSLNSETSPPSSRGPPPPPFPGFMHPFSQAFHGRHLPGYPGGPALPSHHFIPNFKHERDIDAGNKNYIILSVFFQNYKDGSMTLVNKSAPIETLSSVSNTPV